MRAQERTHINRYSYHKYHSKVVWWNTFSIIKKRPVHVNNEKTAYMYEKKITVYMYIFRICHATCVRACVREGEEEGGSGEESACVHVCLSNTPSNMYIFVGV